MVRDTGPLRTYLIRAIVSEVQPMDTEDDVARKKSDDSLRIRSLAAASYPQDPEIASSIRGFTLSCAFQAIFSRLNTETLIRSSTKANAIAVTSTLLTNKNDSSVMSQPQLASVAAIATAPGGRSAGVGGSVAGTNQFGAVSANGEWEV